MAWRTPILAEKLVIEERTESREAVGATSILLDPSDDCDSEIASESFGFIAQPHAMIIDLPPLVKTSILKVPERAMRAGKPRRTHAVWGSSSP